MRVALRLKMPRGSILKGDGEYDPNTGEIIFCTHTDTEVTKRLRRCSMGTHHILEAVAIIEGKELILKIKGCRWFAHKLNFSGKLHPLRWKVPPPAPRWEIPFLRNKHRELQKRQGQSIRFTGLLQQWDPIS